MRVYNELMPWSLRPRCAGENERHLSLSFPAHSVILNPFCKVAKLVVFHNEDYVGTTKTQKKYSISEKRNRVRN